MRKNKGSLNKKHLYTCLIFLSFSLIALKGKDDIRYVHNIEDFRTHTSTHIHNVYTLGMHLYYKYQNTIFRDLPEQVVKEKLLSHDFEKVATLSQLRTIGYDHDKTFLERLYENYGQTKNDNMLDLINELNHYAEYYERSIYSRHSLLNPDGSLSLIAQKISTIEKIADLVEREKNPISSEEFGRQKMMPARRLLRTSLEKQLALELAQAYSNIVPLNPLIHRTSLSQNAPLCHQLFL
jgi:hypothetical protein